MYFTLSLYRLLLHGPQGMRTASNFIKVEALAKLVHLNV